MQADNAAWHRLVKKTRHTPLLYGRPRVKLLPNRAVISSGWMKWVAYTIGAGFGAGLLCMVYFKHDEIPTWGNAILIAFGTLFTLALYNLICTNKVSWKFGGEFHIHYGPFFL